jgi:hypothetical protein
MRLAHGAVIASVLFGSVACARRGDGLLEGDVSNCWPSPSGAGPQMTVPSAMVPFFTTTTIPLRM